MLINIRFRMYWAILMFAVGVAAQTTPIVDLSLLSTIFGPPPDSTSTTTQRSQVVIVPTTGPTVITNKEKESCTCLPYYLCNSDSKAVFMNNASVTGYGVLDIRFGASECQESVERCCTSPKDPAVPVQEPTTTTPIEGCGYKNPLDVTLVGGKGNEALFGEYPWVVALLDAMTNDYVGVGALIHPQVVITAAHVVNQFQPGQLAIRAGEWDTLTLKERLKHQERVVQEIYSRSDAHPLNLYNDVSLLKLVEPVQLAPHINVICLPQQDESFDNSKRCVINGWGKTEFGAKGNYSNFLKLIIQDMIPNARCDALLKNTRLGQKFKLHNSFVCAGGQKGKDVCKGDGGGPLACPIGENRYKLTGLVAWGIGCGEENVPAVYASVAKFRNWIDEKMLAWGFNTNGYIAN